MLGITLNSQINNKFLGNRSTPNIAVWAEFGRLQLLLNAQAKVWNYLEYLRKKTDSCVKESYKIDSVQEQKKSHFQEIELGIKQLLVKNVKKSQDPYNVSKKRVKLFLKNDYVAFWTNKIRNSPTSASYATHKNDYNMEQYLIHVRIKNIVTLWQNSVYTITSSTSKPVGRLGQKHHKTYGSVKNAQNI